jgi:tRNA threonylcarbamoyladenosine biosynthesis protein TsaE
MIKMAYNEAEMKSLGRELADSIKGGDIIELIGDLGSGKTTFVKGLAEGLGITENVQSPSYTLSQQYPTNKNATLVHYDFYRLSDAGILEHELHEYVGNKDYITVIEWGNVVRDILPVDRLTMTIVAPDVNTRRMIIESHGFRSAALAKLL